MCLESPVSPSMVPPWCSGMVSVTLGTSQSPHIASQSVTCSCHPCWSSGCSAESQSAELPFVKGWAVLRAGPCWAQLWSLAALGLVNQAKIWDFGWQVAVIYVFWLFWCYYCLFHIQLLNFPLLNIACPVPGSLPVNMRDLGNQFYQSLPYPGR